MLKILSINPNIYKNINGFDLMYLINGYLLQVTDKIINF